MRIHIDPSNVGELLERGVRLRVFAACDPTAVLDEGELVAYASAPTVVLRHADGTKSSWQVSLPIEEIVGVSAEQSTTQPVEDDLGPSPAQLGETMTVAAGEWTPLDDLGTQLYVYGDQPVDVAVQRADVDDEVRRLNAELEKAQRERDSLARRCAVRFESETKLREALAALNAAAYVQEEPSKDLLDASALADELLSADSRPNLPEGGAA